MLQMRPNWCSKVVAALICCHCVCFLGERQTQAQTEEPSPAKTQVSNEEHGLDQKRDATDMQKHFTLKVLPLLKSKCLGCHGAVEDDIKGEFDVRTRAGLLAGGESGEPGVMPGDLDGSSLIQAVRWDGLEMPPKEMTD